MKFSEDGSRLAIHRDSNFGQVEMWTVSNRECQWTTEFNPDDIRLAFSAKLAHKAISSNAESGEEWDGEDNIAPDTVSTEKYDLAFSADNSKLACMVFNTTFNVNIVLDAESGKCNEITVSDAESDKCDGKSTLDSTCDDHVHVFYKVSRVHKLLELLI